MKRSGHWDLLPLSPSCFCAKQPVKTTSEHSCQWREHGADPPCLEYRKLKYNKTVSPEPMFLSNILSYDEKGLWNSVGCIGWLPSSLLWSDIWQETTWEGFVLIQCLSKCIHSWGAGATRQQDCEETGGISPPVRSQRFCAGPQLLFSLLCFVSFSCLFIFVGFHFLRKIFSAQ